MLEELQTLLGYVNNPSATKTEYLKAIRDDNCLGKRSAKTRLLTYRHLVDLYSLDLSIPIFRALLYFWERDLEGHPFLALFCSYSRDAILRMSAPFILQYAEGATITREALEEFLEDNYPARFSAATLKSTAQNINSTWTKSGHLAGKAKKVRSKAKATSSAVAYALFLAYLTGERGENLFASEFVKILDCSKDRAVELAEEAARRGWIVFKRVGNVMEVLFPNLLTPTELEWLRE